MLSAERKEIKRLRSQAWREANRERHRDYQRQYRLNHADECRERNKKWDLEHPELVAEYKRTFADNNPEAVNESSRKWRRNHPEHKRTLTRQRRAKILEVGGTITTEEWKAVVEKYGPACLCCKEIRALTMDHVIPVSEGGPHVIGNVQPLCLNCNSSKGTKTIDYRQETV